MGIPLEVEVECMRAYLGISEAQGVEEGLGGNVEVAVFEHGEHTGHMQEKLSKNFKNQ